MANIELPINLIVQNGVTIGYTENTKYVTPSPSNDYYLKNDTGRSFLEVYNGSGSDLYITATATKPCNHSNSHDVVYTIPTANSRKIGTFDKDRFNQLSGDYAGSVKLNFSVGNNVKVTAFKLN